MIRVDELEPAADRNRSLVVAASCSLVLHALLLWLFSVGRMLAATEGSAPITVELLEPRTAEQLAALPPSSPPPSPQAAAPEAEVPVPARPETRIVAPPEGPEAIPDEARYLSDRDSRAEQETVKRGEPAPPAPPPVEAARAAPKQGPAAEPGRLAARREPLPSSPQASHLPGLESLFAKPSELIDDPRFGKGTEAEASKEAGRDLAALRRPDLWANPGERGTPDYLPDVRNGSFTLLNTKADLFAPFVRRVGLRVFQTFSMDFKRQIFAGQVPPGQEKIEVEAVMSRDGRRLTVSLRRRDGNLATDRLLLGSLGDHIFFDENPPAKAVAEDGRIHFLFAIDSAVWYSQQQNGALRPAAQWLFGAGLL